MCVRSVGTFPPPPRSLLHRVGHVSELDVDGRSPGQRGEPLGLSQVVLHLLQVSLQQRRLLAACRPLVDPLVHTDTHRPGVQHQVRGPVGVLRKRLGISESAAQRCQPIRIMFELGGSEAEPDFLDCGDPTGAPTSGS